MGVAYDNATFSALAVDKRPVTSSGGLARALDFESVRLKDQEKRALVDCLLAGCSYRVPERFVMENSPCRLKKRLLVVPAGCSCCTTLPLPDCQLPHGCIICASTERCRGFVYAVFSFKKFLKKYYSIESYDTCMGY